MKGKFVYITLALLVVGGLLLSACGRPPATPAEQEPQVPAAEPTAVPAQEEPAQAPEAEAKPILVRATVWIGADEQANLDILVEEFQKKHPNIQFEWIDVTGAGAFGEQKVQTMIGGGDAPDMMMLNTGQFEAFASRGVLLPLDDLVAGDKLDMSIYYPIAVRGCKYNDVLYGLPRDVSPLALFYNKDLFDEAGVPYPDENWTWDDVRDAAIKLTKDSDGDGQIDQWGYAVMPRPLGWGDWVYSNDGQILNPERTKCMLTDPKSLQGLNAHFNLLLKDQVSPPPGALPNMWEGDWFTTQAVAMGNYGPWWRPALVALDKEDQFRWDVALAPKSPYTNKRANSAWTDMWSIYVDAKPEVVEAAWEFMKYYSSEEGQALWTELNGARSASPVRKVTESDAWLHYGGSTGEIFMDMLLNYTTVDPEVNFPAGIAANDLYIQEFGRVIAGEATVEEVAQSICTQLDPLLQEQQ